MNKVRSIPATIALAITLLSGLTLQGMGSLANAASNHYASSANSALVGKSTGSRIRPNWPCPSGVTTDC